MFGNKNICPNATTIAMSSQSFCGTPSLTRKHFTRWGKVLCHCTWENTVKKGGTRWYQNETGWWKCRSSWFFQIRHWLMLPNLQWCLVFVRNVWENVTIFMGPHIHDVMQLQNPKFAGERICQLWKSCGLVCFTILKDSFWNNKSSLISWMSGFFSLHHHCIKLYKHPSLTGCNGGQGNVAFTALLVLSRQHDLNPWGSQKLVPMDPWSWYSMGMHWKTKKHYRLFVYQNQKMFLKHLETHDPLKLKLLHWSFKD